MSHRINQWGEEVGSFSKGFPYYNPLCSEDCANCWAEEKCAVKEAKE